VAQDEVSLCCSNTSSFGNRCEIGTRARSGGGIVADVRFAISRHRQLLHDLVVALDEDGVSIAETWRAVGDAAWKLGLRRPGYHVVRELVRAERARRHARAATREALLGVFESLPSALLLDQRRAIERLAEARRRERLVLEQHKPP
jgi:hypothetical protein